MSRTRRDLCIALAATLVGHSAVGLMVSTIEKPIIVLVQEVEISFEVSNGEFPAIEPEPVEPELVEPEPDEPEPVEPEPVEPEPVERTKPTRAKLRPNKVVRKAAPPPTDNTPAPGNGAATSATPADKPSAPSLPGGQVFDLASLSSGGAVPVAVGSKPGLGGSNSTGKGKRTGKAGSGDELGGSGRPPVSVAMLKKRPVPIGDTDFIDARKNYPPAAKAKGIEGTIKVKIVVDTNGEVRGQPKLITRLGHGLDQLAIRLARKLRFRPAIDSNDSPVPATVVWTFNFTLPR